MKVIGIIAEYNPFHNGHLYQINKIKELYKDSLIIVILNGNFTQRGETSIINKWDKTKIILNNNVDLVVELPLYYGINNANIFAYGSLKILNELKIDLLIFGSESNNLELLIDLVKNKINNNKYELELKKELKNGLSFPLASSHALEKISGVKIDTPNDILGMAYIEEIVKNDYKIEPICIKRTNDYHSNKLESISSASAIRNAILKNDDISNTVPKDTLKYINDPIYLEDFFEIIKYKILSTKDLSIYHDVNEGIENRIKKYIIDINNLDEFILKIKTKRYTYNRIKRILLYILLDMKKDDKIPELYIRPLGFNKKGLKYLNKVKKKLNIPLIINYSKSKNLLELEYKANSIYSLKKQNTNDEIKKELNKPIIKSDEL